jgi:hypothetical protein
MTPNDKAKYLINKYEKKLMYDYNNYTYKYNLEHCKQCALIAINEIVEAIEWHEYETPNKEIRFWMEVKQEIEKL